MIQDCISYLNAELTQRQTKNPRFSLRSFAHMLEVSPAQLSQVLSGKRPLTRKMALKFSKQLKLSPLEEKSFVSSIQFNHEENSLTEGRIELKEDEFKLISDWYHFAILSLAELKDNKANVHWISKRLNISLREAAEAYHRLLRMGLIKETSSGRFEQVGSPIITSNDVLSRSIQKNHIQILGLAQQKIESTPVEMRDYQSVTMAINTNNLSKAKKYIREFKRNLSTLLEKGNKSEVYTLSIQLFPLSQLLSKEEK